MPADDTEAAKAAAAAADQEADSDPLPVGGTPVGDATLTVVSKGSEPLRGFLGPAGATFKGRVQGELSFESRETVMPDGPTPDPEKATTTLTAFDFEIELLWVHGSADRTVMVQAKVVRMVPSPTMGKAQAAAARKWAKAATRGATAYVFRAFPNGDATAPRVFSGELDTPGAANDALAATILAPFARHLLATPTDPVGAGARWTVERKRLTEEAALTSERVEYTLGTLGETDARLDVRGEERGQKSMPGPQGEEGELSLDVRRTWTGHAKVVPGEWLPVDATFEWTRTSTGTGKTLPTVERRETAKLSYRRAGKVTKQNARGNDDAE